MRKKQFHKTAITLLLSALPLTGCADILTNNPILGFPPSRKAMPFCDEKIGLYPLLPGKTSVSEGVVVGGSPVCQGICVELAPSQVEYVDGLAQKTPVFVYGEGNDEKPHLNGNCQQRPFVVTVPRDPELQRDYDDQPYSRRYFRYAY